MNWRRRQMNGRTQGFIVGVVAGGCLLAFSQA